MSPVGQPLNLGTAPGPQLVAFMRRIAHALGRLSEEDFLHRDISAGNLIVLNKKIYLIDMGTVVKISDMVRVGSFDFQCES